MKKISLLLCLFILAGCSYKSKIVIEGKNLKYGFIKGDEVKVQKDTDYRFLKK